MLASIISREFYICTVNCKLYKSANIVLKQRFFYLTICLQEVPNPPTDLVDQANGEELDLQEQYVAQDNQMAPARMDQLHVCHL